MAIAKKTHEQFLKDLEVKNPKVYLEIEFLERYKGDKVKILAKDTYGAVWVIPSNILQGGGTSIRSALCKTTYFISKSNVLHNYKYDYSLSEYKNDSKNVKIICKKHGVFEQPPTRHLQGAGCPYCSNNKTLIGVTDIATTNKELLSYLCDKNDGFKYSKNSDKEVMCKCPDCGFIKSTKMCNLYNNGFSCPKCSDGISMPEKIMSNILTHLNINFKTQYSPNWALGKKYDFFIYDLNVIIETHGIQHYEENNGYMAPLKEQQYNDELKYNLAVSNGVSNYIVVDCRFSSIDFLEYNIKKSLYEILDLSSVDFEKIYKESLNSKVIQACKLFNDGVSIEEISNNLSLSKSSIRNYLRKCTSLGLCNYK